MAANIDSYIGRESAWHKLGTVTGHYMTWQEILDDGGLNFSIFKSQLRDGRNQPIEAWGMFRWDKATDPQAEKTVFLGTVGKDYTPIHHAKGFELIDSLIASADGAHYETAGSLGVGELVWGLADLKLTINVGDDVQNGYLLFSTGHDGSLSHTYRVCITRVVCHNTLTAALGEKSKNIFKVRHTKSAMERITNAHAALANLSVDVKSMEDKLNFLAGKKVTRESLDTIMNRLFPAKTEVVMSESNGPVLVKDSKRRENMLASILAIYETNDNNAFPEQRGTAYNLLNAITNYTDHDRSTRGNGNGGTGRAESALFGSGDALKTRALAVISDAAETMPAKSAYGNRTLIGTAVMDAPLAEVEPQTDTPSVGSEEQQYIDDVVKRYL